MMLRTWLAPVLYGLGALVALEILYLLLRRALRWFRLAYGYHLFSTSVAVLIVLAVAGADTAGLAWKVTATAASLLTALVAFELVNAALIRRPWSRAAAILPRLARDVLRMGVLIAVGLVAATTIFEAELSTILVSSTVLTAVVGLALQDVLKNVFAGMALDLDKPFVRGDWLMLDRETVGEVVEMSWRSVRLRTREGIHVSEPNTTISALRLVNLGSGAEPVGLAFRVGLPYDAPPEEVKRALRDAACSVPGTLEDPPVEVVLESYGDHAITYYMRVWVKGLNRERFRDDVYSRIWYVLKRRGLSIPFPIRTVHLHSAESMATDDRRRLTERAMRRLAQLDLFRELPSETLESLAAGAVLHRFDSGEVLVREGEAGESLMVIDSGSAVASQAPGELGGVDVQIGRLAEGDFFGEYSLLTGEARSATVRADGECAILEIAKRQIAELFEADPRIAVLLSRALAARQELAAVSLECHRDRLGSGGVESEDSILHRIRSFFRLS